jgi:hypothetical protein
MFHEESTVFADKLLNMRLKVHLFVRSIQAILLFFCLSASLSAFSHPKALLFVPYFYWGDVEQNAYSHLLNLRFSSARVAIESIPDKNLVRVYLENWIDVLEIIGNQDKNLYANKLHLREKRLELIERSHKNSPFHLFLQAEIRLQWALAQAVFDEPLAAAWNIRKAFQLLESNSQLYPDFEGNRKSLGVLQILFGTVPAQYEWLLSLWGLSGSVSKGFQMLSEVAAGSSPYAAEAQLWQVWLKTLLGDEVGENVATHGKWIIAAALRKSGNSEKALQLLHDLPTDAPSLLCWEKATALLNSGNYREALEWLHLFEKKHRGTDLLKDAQLKRFWCYWLQNQDTEAMAALRKISTTGRTKTDADKNAAYFAAQRPLPDKRLIQARLLTDGGYFERSADLIQQIDIQALDRMNRCELYYRRARNAHRLDNLPEALMNYEQCLTQAGGAAWYFLPNAALQAGIIYRDYQKDTKKARYYFNRALDYQQHPYKASIDRKAKAALKSLAR